MTIPVLPDALFHINHIEWPHVKRAALCRSERIIHVKHIAHAPAILVAYEDYLLRIGHACETTRLHHRLKRGHRPIKWNSSRPQHFTGNIYASRSILERHLNIRILQMRLVKRSQIRLQAGNRLPSRQHVTNRRQTDPTVGRNFLARVHFRSTSE